MSGVDERGRSSDEVPVGHGLFGARSVLGARAGFTPGSAHALICLLPSDGRSLFLSQYLPLEYVDVRVSVVPPTAPAVCASACCLPGC